MLDIKNTLSSIENFRLEAKKAAVGLPDSLWESYSAFANSDGGIILLGVSEVNNTLQVTGVTDAQKKVQNIWDQLNNRQKVNVNILSERHVYIQQSEGKEIIVIEVPRADRHDKPVYINNDLFRGTYRRNAEGDYHCSAAEVKAMLRDQSDIPADSTVIDELNLSDLDTESIGHYRNHFAALKPAHVWNRLDIDSFLQKTGAGRRAESGKLKPTLAGLLMFGTEDIITQILPDYFLDYREIYTTDRWSDRVVSNLGEWSGNIYDFFFKIVNKLTSDIKIPFRIRNGIERISDTSLHIALREALANALIHADYYGRRGIVIEKRPEKIVIANPGIFRPNIVEALAGGVSDPRNPTIFKMFALIDIGERAGSGLFNIQTVWKDMGWAAPVLKEQLSPERTTLTMQIELEDRLPENLDRLPENSDKLPENPDELLEKLPENLDRLPENPDELPEKLPENLARLPENSDGLLENSIGLGENLDKLGENSDRLGEKLGENLNRLGENSDKLGENFERLGEKLGENPNGLGENLQKIIETIKNNPAVTISELSDNLFISKTAIKNNINKLKKLGIIERIGPDKGGYWQTIN